MITIEKLSERHETISEDIRKVEETIANLDAQRSQTQANLYALQGALQQVEYFLKECEEKESKSEDKSK